MREFFKVMIENLSRYFNDAYRQTFTNQTIDSCMGLYNLCKNENPDTVIEIGTNHGASTFALGVAMKSLGKDASLITSIDLDHKKWKKSFDIHKNLLKEYGLNLKKVKTITANFNDIDPKVIIDSSKRIFIFYDMHDHTGPWSQRLLDRWVPLVKNGTFSIHDISPTYESYKIAHDIKSPRTKIRYMSGQYFTGFNECFRIIKWANNNKIDIKIFPGGVYFRNG